MATKLQLITAMYDHNVKHVTDNSVEWQRFLHSASRNYKLAFEEQILVHAQRPDATAVLELEKWNTQFGRWVNKGATGIAVVDRDFPGKRRLKYYFDVSLLRFFRSHGMTLPKYISLNMKSFLSWLSAHNRLERPACPG